MKRALALGALGLVALVAQGAAGMVLSPPWCPDLVLLVLIAIGLRWSGTAAGLAVAAVLGYATDLLSGSLLGQHALLDLLAFSATLLATRQLNLRGPLPLAVFAGALTFLYGLGMLAVTGFFVGVGELRLGWIGDQLIHAVVMGVFAPSVSSAIGRVDAWLGEDEPGARGLELGPRGRRGSAVGKP